MIEKYVFGEMTGFGKTVSGNAVATTEDLFERGKFYPKFEGHFIGLEEVKVLAEKFKPEILVIGTGAYGVAEVAPEVKPFLQEKGIQLVQRKTDEAKNYFNELLKRKKNVLGLFHLTC